MIARPAADLALRYLGRLEDGDRSGALAVVQDALAAGLTPEQVVSEVLASAQVQVGRGWQDSRWTIAMEHRASAITESAIELLSLAVLAAPDRIAEGSAGRTMVLCAEGEWHSLPARMFSQVLRWRGMDVTFVGPSLPAAEVPALLGDRPPPVVAVACSLPFILGGAARTITACRQVGVAVVAGGRGFGLSGSWGLAVGADAVAPDFTSGADTVLALAAQPPPLPRPSALDPAAQEEVAVVGRVRVRMIEEAVAQALESYGTDAAPEHVVAATRHDLGASLDAVLSAVLVSDPRLVREFVEWFEQVIAARDLPLTFVTTAFTVLEAVLPSGAPRARGMARAGRLACTQPLAVTQPLA